VAIAGILAMKPEVLILDEPAAGLDPGMKQEIFSMIDGIRCERRTAVILVSHEMEDIAVHADRVMLMHEGRIGLTGTPKQVFSQVEKVRELGGEVPEVTDIMYELRRMGLPLGGLELSAEAAAVEIAGALTGEVSGS
jgi:energy-coupling factor transport system ATP-binding protein